MADIERYHALCARIREHCIQHGPDGEDGAFYWPAANIYPLDGHGRRAWSTLPEPRNPFIYPPANEEQLRATEAALGFSLPLLLRMLYTEVANGGFGPGYGITGAKGGFSVNDDGHYDTIDRYTDIDPKLTHVTLVTLDTGPDEELFTVHLPYNQWPAKCLHLAYGGCGCDFWLDVSTGRIYWGGCGMILAPNEFLQRITGDLEATSLEPTNYLQRVAPSLEVWIEAWLQGDHEGVYEPPPLMQGGGIPY